MEQNQKMRPEPIRGGAFFPLVSLVLTLVALWGLLTVLSPSATLSRALENTAEGLIQREEGVLEVLGTLKEGSILLSDGAFTGEYTASLPEKSALSLKTDSFDLALTAAEDTLAFQSKSLLSQSLSGPRRGAASAFSQSAFSAAKEEEGSEVIPIFLALSDPDLWEEEAVGEVLKAMWKASSPERETQRASLFRDEKEISVSRQHYRFDSESLVAALDALTEMGQEEEIKNSLLAKNTLFRTLLGKEAGEGEKTRFLEFLSGKGEDFSRLKEIFSEEKSLLTLDFSIRREKVIHIKIAFTLDSLEGTGEIYFGESVGEDEKTEISFLVREGEESVFSLTGSLLLSENSKNAYVRELSYSLTDPKGVLLSASDPVSGKIRYSWGKVKSDLGLRLITPHRQVGFGGTLKENRSGKKVVEISRFEIDRKNQLVDKTLTLTLNAEPKEVTLPKTEGALFPEGEEKAALEASFTEKFRALFGGGDSQ